jgi:hypothetical protein
MTMAFRGRHCLIDMELRFKGSAAARLILASQIRATRMIWQTEKLAKQLYVCVVLSCFSDPIVFNRPRL